MHSLKHHSPWILGITSFNKTFSFKSLEMQARLLGGWMPSLLMSQSTHTTLADLMVMLPNLNPRLLTAPNVARLKHLRLVNKEVGKVALAAVKRCTVYLGHGSSEPGPHSLVLLLAGAQLEELTVNVTVESGGCRTEKAILVANGW